MMHLDRTIIGFALATTLSAGVVYFQVNDVMQSQRWVEKKRSEFLSKNGSVFTNLDDSDFLEANYTSFRGILDKNTSDSKSKVKWIKLLESAKSQLDLAEMSFEIYPARSIAQNQAELLVAVSVEVIELKVSVLHDGKISELVNYLNTYAPNEFVITALDIKRNRRKIDNGITTAKMINLDVLFTIKWYSIDVIGESNDIQS